jgi:hypothetical protein
MEIIAALVAFAGLVVVWAFAPSQERPAKAATKVAARGEVLA